VTFDAGFCTPKGPSDRNDNEDTNETERQRAQIRTRLGLDDQSRQQMVTAVQWHSTNTFEMVRQSDGRAQAHIWRPSLVEKALAETSDIQTPREVRLRRAVIWLQLQPKSGAKMVVDESDEEMHFDVTPPPKYSTRPTIFKTRFAIMSVPNNKSPPSEAIRKQVDEWKSAAALKRKQAVDGPLSSVLPIMQNVSPPAGAPMVSALKDNRPALSEIVIKRMEDNRAAALKRKQEKLLQAADGPMLGVLSLVPPSACSPMESALKENKPPLSDAIIKRMADNRAAALKRKQAADADMAQFTPRCRAKLEISEQAENFEMALKRENKPPVHPASIRQITAPAVPTNCNCIKCAGVRATPIVAKCVVCDASVVYSICALHYPNTLSFHNEVQARSRSILCFFCKNAMDA